MAPMGSRAQANSHLLNDNCHQECQEDKGDKEANAKLGTGCCVREHARTIVFAQHDQNPGADEKP
jgi:hypothetical protein